MKAIEVTKELLYQAEHNHDFCGVESNLIRVSEHSLYKIFKIADPAVL